MKLLLVDNAHIYRTQSGKYYAPSIYGDEFFERYLKVFDKLRFVAKVKDIDIEDVDNLLEITNPNVEIIAIPWYQGLEQLVKKLVPVCRSYKRIADGCDSAVLRIAQLESFFTFIFSKIRKKPFVVEVVNDPLEFRDMNVLMRFFTVLMTRILLSNAVGASYVTKEYLQKKYPCKNVVKGNGFTSYYSSILLTENDFLKDKKQLNRESLHLVHISNAINSNIKGHIESIKVVKGLVEKGVNCYITFIGDGSAIDKFKQVASEEGIEERIDFVGRISSHVRLMKILQDSDIFIFPTKLGEGLPRVVIEAMAAGLPCFVAPAGGIGELLEEDSIIKADEIDKYVEKVIELYNNDELYQANSERNKQVARGYLKELLDKRRVLFYCDLLNYCLKQKSGI